MSVEYRIFLESDDAELQAIEMISHALKELEPDMKRRVVRYAADRWASERDGA